MTYVKCRWNESRGDRHWRWGGFGPDGAITRQVEVYDSGARLWYGPNLPEDTLGRLGEGRRQDMDMQSAVELTSDEFERVWATVISNASNL